jgi:hypothetical protein
MISVEYLFPHSSFSMERKCEVHKSLNHAMRGGMEVWDRYIRPSGEPSLQNQRINIERLSLNARSQYDALQITPGDTRTMQVTRLVVGVRKPVTECTVPLLIGTTRLWRGGLQWFQDSYFRREFLILLGKGLRFSYLLARHKETSPVSSPRKRAGRFLFLFG